MLSDTLVAMLDALKKRSDAAWREGGLLYSYVEAAGQAHARLPAGGRLPTTLAPDDVQALGRFIQAAECDYLRDTVAPEHLSTARAVLAQLHADLCFDEVHWTIEDGGHDMTCTVAMARRADNRYFKLELFWSVD